MQHKIRIAIIAIVLVTASLFGAYWIQKYLQGSRAAAAPPTVSLFVAGLKVNPGDPFDLAIQINPNMTPFYSFDLALTYDASKVSFQNTDPTTLTSNIIPLSTKGNGVMDVKLLTGVGSTSIDTTAHIIRISGIRAGPDGNAFTGREPLNIAKISLVMNEGTSLPLVFKWIDPDTSKITNSDMFEKKNLTYTGEDPTPTPAPTGIPEVNVPTSATTPGTQQNPKAPVPTGVDGTTPYNERKDLLYINSMATYQAPFRYEQPVKLEKGTYTLTVGAKVHANRGGGMYLGLICNESACGGHRLNEFTYKTPVFPLKTTFSEMKKTITIPENADNKSLLLRIFCEDGSECEIDSISLEDNWGTERLQNTQFEASDYITDPRRQPAEWEVDPTANLYGSIDPTFGNNGALMINNSLK